MSEVDLGNPNGLGAASDAVSLLHQVLMKPELTLEDIERFSSTGAGYSAWGNITSLPAYLLASPKIAMIKKSVSVYLACQHNGQIKEQLGDWDVYSLNDSALATEISTLSEVDFNAWLGAETDTLGLYNLCHSANALDLILSNENKTNGLISSEWAIAAMLKSPSALSALFGTPEIAQKVAQSTVFMSYVASDELAMSVIADDIAALTAIFAEVSARTILWDGGQMPADKLMRESEVARAWLIENIAIVRTGEHETTYNNNKKSYLLTANKAAGNSTHYYKVGRFAGDYTTTEYVKTNLAITANERVLSMVQIDDGTMVPSVVTYIEME